MASALGATYRSLRIATPVALILQLGIRLVIHGPAVFPDLILFNLVGFIAALVIALAPSFNDRKAKYSIALGMVLWSFGSTISTWNSFYKFQIFPNLTDYTYALFYPLMLFGILRALSVSKKIVALELLDTVIIALGSSSVIASFLLRPAMLKFDGSAISVFFSILYPTGDLVLVAITISLVVLQKRTKRSLFLLSGTLLFAITDLYFLLVSATGNYSFGALTDDGWLLGLILIAESLWHPGGEVQLTERVNSFMTTSTLVISSSILAVAAIKPGYFPTFVLIPGFATVILAFLRMAVALRDAKSVTQERELARTDELTGLPNRRRFLVELEILRRKEGVLLLMDLNGFKAINDQYGHAVGDQLLKQVTTRFQRAIPSDVLLARLGGDEFGAIIYSDTSYANEIALALRATTTYPFQIATGEISIGVSIGSVSNDQATENKEDLLRRADSAMYEAKRAGLGLVNWS
jgi:diguanylate cyclase (GGDEF)-like protein